MCSTTTTAPICAATRGATLSENGRKLVASPQQGITIEGHDCDERGTVDYNLALG